MDHCNFYIYQLLNNLSSNTCMLKVHKSFSNIIQSIDTVFEYVSEIFEPVGFSGINLIQMEKMQ